MKKLVVFSIIACGLTSFAQVSPNQNYIQTTTYRTPFQEDDLPEENQQGNSKLETVTYFDGLGRPMQRISLRAGGSNEDIITHVGYDENGLDTKNYLPFSMLNNKGSLRSGNPELETLNFYNVGKYGYTQNPYSDKRYEKSPLRRVLEQGAPGNDWKIDESSDLDHTVKFEYTSNEVSDEVINFQVVFNGSDMSQPTLSRKEGHFLEGVLYKNITKNENWKPSDGKNNTSEEFKTKLGQVILKRTYNDDEKHDTYYIYDDFGNLTYVLPPKINHEWLILKPTAKYGDLEVSYNESKFTFSYSYPPTGSGMVYVTIANDILQVHYGGYFSVIRYPYGVSNATKVRNGNVGIIPTSVPLPDMFLGTLNKTNDLGENIAVEVRIKDGYLHQTVNSHTYIEGYFTGGFQKALSDINKPGSNVADQAILDELAYQYKYDDKNRLVEKKVPGKGWEYIIYNKLDQPVLTQNQTQRQKNLDEWIFTKYDEFGRVVYTGLYKYNSGRINIQSLVDNHSALWEERIPTLHTMNNGTKLYYTNNAFPYNGDLTIYTVNYYDQYGNIPRRTSSVYGESVTSNVKGLLVSAEARVLETDLWHKNRKSYDKYGQVIHNATHFMSNSNIDSGPYEYSMIQRNFEGNITMQQTYQRLSSDNPFVMVQKSYSFDNYGRMKSLNYNVNGSSGTIAYNTYDDLGRLQSKKVGNNPSAPLQTVDYGYNIRGWLSAINDINKLDNDLFAFKLNYSSTEMGSSNSPLFNGNISETIWKTVNDVPLNKIRGYAYMYDDMNRIINGDYGIKTTGSFNLDSGFDISISGYDKNGNILGLNRGDSSKHIDQLSYEYYNDGQSNRLKNVIDGAYDPQGEGGFYDGNRTLNGAPDYLYDAEGNLKTDFNKSIYTISYNHLGLPKEAYNNPYNKVDFSYNALGEKVQKTYKSSGNQDVVTNYFGEFYYKNNLLEFIQHPEGYVTPGANGKYNFVFNYVDHLGNVRLTYADLNNSGTIEASSEILKERNYYPFGMEHKGYNYVVNGAENNHQTFNGKELNESLGLNVVEMDFRQYDTALGRFMSIDALSELAQNMTPYRFGFNNPIAFSDPTGLWESNNGGWYTDDTKDIARFMDMIAIEEGFNGGASNAQIDTFIGEEFRGSGGRLSDGSLLLDSQVLIGDSNGNSSGFSPRQADQISNEIAQKGSHWWNEKSGDFNSTWHTYKYYRERSYHNRGGGFSGVALGAGALGYASNRLNNAQGWYSFTQGKTYGHNFYGNQYTERRAAVVKLSSFLDLTGKALTVYGMAQTAQQMQQGYLTKSGAAYLIGTDAAGMRNPTMAAWSFGTSLGKMTVESGWYYKAVHDAPNW